MGALEPGHLLILLVVLFVVVGPARLPEVGRAAGEALKEFRRATADLRDAAHLDGQPSAAAPSVPAGQAEADSRDGSAGDGGGAAV